MGGWDVLIYIWDAVLGAILTCVLVFVGTFILASLDGNPTGRGAWSFTLFFSLPIAAIVGAIAGLIYASFTV